MNSAVADSHLFGRLVGLRRHLGAFVMVGQEDQNNEAQATEKAEQSKPLRVPLAFGVIHAAPNKKDYTHQYHYTAKNRCSSAPHDNKLPCNLKKDADSNSNVRFGFVFR